ncbi:MAG: hypothetical protein ACK56I_29975, partial [bacterium]
MMFLQDFSKFLSLLKMSGVLKPGADLTAVLQAGDRKHRPGIAGVLKTGADLTAVLQAGDRKHHPGIAGVLNSGAYLT